MAENEIEGDDPVEDIEVEIDDVEDIDAGLEEDLTDPELDPGPSTETETETPEPPQRGSPREQALAGLDADLRADTLRHASEYGVTHADDPLWSMVRAVAEAVAASKSAGEAAEATRQAVERLDEAPASIEKAALDGAGRAAAEIQEHAAKAAEAVVTSLGRQIEIAASEPFRKALKPFLRDLEREAGDVRSAIREGTGSRVDRLVREFLGHANKELDRRSVSTKTAGRLSAVLLLVLGAAIGVAGTRLDHHWSPTPVHAMQGGGFSVLVPPGHDGRFRHCGPTQYCAFIYPTHHAKKGQK